MKKVLCIILFILALGGAVMTVTANSEAKEQEINGILRYPVDAASYINCDGRGNLANLKEAMSDKKLTVAYLGGSVTYGQGAYGNGYVNNVTKYFEDKGIDVTPVYAGIGSTGSRLGAFRLQEHILDYKPDLVFVEYAVNDPYYPEGNGRNYDGLYFEYIIREIRKQLPKAEVVVLLATNTQYAHNGGKFDSFGCTGSAHEEIAKHYNAVSIDMGGYLVESIYGGRTPVLLSSVTNRNSVDWENASDDVIAWQRFFGTKDIVHPNATGYKVYAEAIASYLDGAFEASAENAAEYTLPEAIYGADKFLASAVDLNADDTVIMGFEYQEKMTTGYHGILTPEQKGPYSISFKFDGFCDQLALFVEKVPKSGEYKFEFVLKDKTGKSMITKTGDLRALSYRRHILILKKADFRKLDRFESYDATLSFMPTEDTLTSCNIASIMLGGSIPEYKDVSKDAWYYKNVGFVSLNKLMDGMSADEFKPDTLLTREMLVTSLYKNEGSPKVTGEGLFKDVEAGSAYEKAVIWASQNGIVNGVSKTEFAPNANITREQIAAIIYRYANYKKLDTSKAADLSAFADAPTISDWAKEAMGYTVAAKLIGGKSATSVAPKDYATRAEIAAILQRFIEGNE